MEIKTKFKPGDKVYWISIFNDIGNKNYLELSIDKIESVVIYDDRVTYWLASSDWEVEESSIVPYDKDILFEYISENLKVNEVDA